MREAFEAAMRDQQDPLVTEIVEEARGKIVRQETAHDRHLAKVTEDPQGWRAACDEWYRIGIDYYGNPRSSVEANRRAKRQVYYMAFWEEEGVTHLLGRLERGLRTASPVEGTGLSFGMLLDARETGVATLDFQSETFVQEFKDLSLSIAESENLDQFLLEQRFSVDNDLPYYGIRKVLPLVARWINHQYGPKEPTL